MWKVQTEASSFGFPFFRPVSRGREILIKCEKSSGAFDRSVAVEIEVEVEAGRVVPHAIVVEGLLRCALVPVEIGPRAAPGAAEAKPGAAAAIAAPPATAAAPLITSRRLAPDAIKRPFMMSSCSLLLD